MSSTKSPENRRLRAWLPVLAWAALISLFSTHWFGSEETSRILIPLLRWLLPTLIQRDLEALHHIIRKGAHVSEYFVLSLLIHRRLRADGWHPAWAALSALCASAGYACLDELHQGFVVGRTARWGDVSIDVAGAAAAQVLLLSCARSRRASVRAQPG